MMHAPSSLSEALDVRARAPAAVPVHGGTDLMVEMTFRQREPEELLNLERVSELGDWATEEGTVRIGAGVTFARLMEPPFDGLLPSLAEAARTVGSPQIRNRATIGGNLGTASPAGDGLPPLLAHEAEVEVASEDGTRRIPLQQFLVAPKRTTLGPNELIGAVRMRPLAGAQTFMKIGTRNAMVISVASLAVAVDEQRGEVRAAYGSAGPVVGLVRLPLDSIHALPEAVADKCEPIDDVRGSAEYRRHALRVLATRAVERCRG